MSLHRQRGFLYLTTGANGAGKTLFTLKEVRERSLKESRPVYHNGRFRLKADFGWKQIDFKDWQSCPDGSIFLIDECHNDMPVRRAGSDVPEHIRMLAEHRVRGFDFYLISQHPGNLDVFVRRIIGSPGWHRHLKNFKGSPLVSKIEWSAVNLDCEKPSSGESGTVEMVARPKEVFDWYESATLHTAQRRLPKQLWVALACFLAIPVLAWVAWSKVGQTSLAKINQKPAIEAQQDGQQNPVNRHQVNQPQNAPPMTPREYAQTHQPRFEGLPHTAPRYDAMTQPAQVPYPAACIATASKCNCFTQQATPLSVPDQLCRDIVKGGIYVDWVPPVAAPQQAERQAERRPPDAGQPSGPQVTVWQSTWDTDRIARANN